MSTYKAGDGWTLTELEALGVTELRRTGEDTWEGETADDAGAHLVSCVDPDCHDPAHR